MPSIQISQQSSRDSQELFEAIQKLFGNDSDLRRLDPDYTAQFDSAKLNGALKGRHFSAHLSVCSEPNGCRVDIKVDLPFHLALMKSIIESKLKAKIQDLLKG